MNIKNVRIAVIRIEGTNCEQESLDAFKRLGAQPEFVHLKQLLHIDCNDDECDGIHPDCIQYCFDEEYWQSCFHNVRDELKAITIFSIIFNNPDLRYKILYRFTKL